MEINGEHEGSSGSRAMARFKYKNALKEKENMPDKEMGEEMGEGGGEDVKGMEKLHAKAAKKSAHIYHDGSKYHVHMKDHEAGSHTHQEHEALPEAMDAANEHLGGEPDSDEEGQDQEANPMASLGLGIR